MSKKNFVIVNPQAGGGRAGRLWPALSKVLKKDLGSFDSAETSTPGGGITLARKAAEKGFEAVIAFGGDGTIHEVVNGLHQAKGSRKPVLGILSGGTGGDLAKTLGLPHPLKEQIRVLAKGRTRWIDAGRITYRNPRGRNETRLFINAADAGLGGDVAGRIQKAKGLFGRRLAYLGATLQSYRHWKPERIRIEANPPLEWQPPDRPLAVVVSNGCSFGGGMVIAPHADLSDGWLDLIIVAPLPVLQIPRMLTQLYLGRIEHVPGVQTARIWSLDLKSIEPVPIDVDGESLGTLPISFTVVPKAVEVLVP